MLALQKKHEVELKKLECAVITKKGLYRASNMQIERAQEHVRQHMHSQYAQKISQVVSREKALQNKIDLFDKNPAAVSEACGSNLLSKINHQQIPLHDHDLRATWHDGFLHGYAEANQTRDRIKCQSFDRNDVKNPQHPYARGHEVATHAIPIAQNQEKSPIDRSWDTRKYKSEWNLKEHVWMPEIKVPKDDKSYWHGICAALNERGLIRDDDDVDDSEEDI